jgi:hypothetical protein
MKIQPPFKVERENDMHMPPANPTSQKENLTSKKKKISPTLNRKPHLSDW